MFCVYTSEAVDVVVRYENEKFQDDIWGHEFTSDTLVSDVKKEFANEEGVKVEQVSLVYDGEPMDDSKTLSDYGMTDDENNIEGIVDYES
ncbi:hypothetical protein JTB14_005232 [Gonioctena quinquepunctata]|nr:hypothetical protein JTB14_005232 [Gonioctena quinquepunctata]